MTSVDDTAITLIDPASVPVASAASMASERATARLRTY
jgi:hypothetical protein